MKTLVWVIGQGGMLGQAMSRAIKRNENTTRFDSANLSWSDAELLRNQVAQSTQEMIRTSRAEEMRWCIVWVAGAAVTSATQEEVAAELATFRLVIATIGSEVAGHEARGSLFVASSAGGVYGASLHPPFTENTPPVARSPYGQLKLDQEIAAAEITERGLPVLIGRITNLYGPGQSLAKMQGLISHLALAILGGKPVSIFVPLETLRDFIYVDDCAFLILAAIDRLVRVSAGRGIVVTKIIGSGYVVSISSLLGFTQSIGKRRPHAVLGSSPHAANQALDLRICSIVWPDLDRFEKTSLPAGFHSTIIGVLGSLQNGSTTA
jgi:UDP-glucose 4-epimerase